MGYNHGWRIQGEIVRPPSIAVVVVLAFAVSLTAGCKKDDPAEQTKRALKERNPDKAIPLLKAEYGKDPQNLEIIIALARSHATTKKPNALMSDKCSTRSSCASTSRSYQCGSELVFSVVWARAPARARAHAHAHPRAHPRGHNKKASARQGGGLKFRKGFTVTF